MTFDLEKMSMTKNYQENDYQASSPCTNLHFFLNQMKKKVGDILTNHPMSFVS